MVARSGIEPPTQGFSARNLKYMRAFAKAWPKLEIVQEALAQLPWYHQIALLEKLNTEAERLWYASKAYEYGWSHNILKLQIDACAHLRHGKALNNFSVTLPSTESDMAVQAFKDPYLFDFLGTDAPRREVELERGLMEHMQKFLLEPEKDWWPDPESNWGHRDFQSLALPTELSGHF
jgi:predicted nuclease of restriction endonuclease-like (RecB) superfamily